MKSARRSRLRLAGAVAGVLVLAAAVVAWRVVTTRTANAVSTTWTAHCPGSQVRAGRTTTVEDRPGWSCTIVLRIANTADHPVRVSRITAPYAGPGSKIMWGRSSDGARFSSVPDEAGEPPSFTKRYAIDGAFAVGRTIAAHSSITVALGVGEPRQVCTSPGTSAGTIDWPTVELTTWHRSFERSAHQSLSIRHPERRARDCDRTDG